jgi:hypothetical protein
MADTAADALVGATFEDEDDVICCVCGELYMDGHMPACPNSAAGQPFTWVGAVVAVLRQSGTPLSADDILKKIQQDKLRFVSVRVNPKNSLRKALTAACRGPEASTQKHANNTYSAIF